MSPGMRASQGEAAAPMAAGVYAPGRDVTIYHDGIYVGGGRMINAARPGTAVRLDSVDAMSGFAGGARLP
ncbi:hypothetical protein [Streptomyces sp. NPDC052107]|uniref:hypothetical protein n=1 Tax=Streptomyces sp. NPDC052107 TaxID=3155632 RepID=UPI003441334E